MKCPACERAMSVTQVGSISLDVCQGGCGGIWFDAFELQRLGKLSEPVEEQLCEVTRDPKLKVDTARKRACPRCPDIKLTRRPFGPESKVEVDVCPNCGGYWLDAGELEKIRHEHKPAAAKSASGDAAQINAAAIRYIYQMQTGQRPAPRVS